MARLVSWATATGGAGLAALTHVLPLLILVAAAVALAGLLVLAWILSDDRRTDRLNLLLRGDRPPAPAAGGAAAEPATGPESAEASPESAEAGAGIAPAEPRPPISAQTMDYAAFLRRAGRPDLAELLEQAPQQDVAVEPAPDATTGPQRT